MYIICLDLIERQANQVGFYQFFAQNVKKQNRYILQNSNSATILSPIDIPYRSSKENISDHMNWVVSKTIALNELRICIEARCKEKSVSPIRTKHLFDLH